MKATTEGKESLKGGLAEQSLEEQLWPKRSPLDAEGQGSDTSGGGRGIGLDQAINR